MESFNVSIFTRRVKAEFDVQRVRVGASPGSVVVTTEIPLQNFEKAKTVADRVTALAGDAASLRVLYGAPTTIENVRVHSASADAHAPPPSAPPSDDEEEGDGTVRAIVAVFLALAVIVAALVIGYCVSFDPKEKPAARRGFNTVGYIGASIEAPAPASVRFRL